MAAWRLMNLCLTAGPDTETGEGVASAASREGDGSDQPGKERWLSGNLHRCRQIGDHLNLDDAGLEKLSDLELAEGIAEGGADIQMSGVACLDQGGMGMKLIAAPCGPTPVVTGMSAAGTPGDTVMEFVHQGAAI